MGCCSSLLVRSPPYPSAPSSSTAINTTTAAPPSDAASTTPARRNRRSPLPRRPLTEHFNSPLVTHPWASTNHIWTRAQLDRERTAFFETRVSGRAEIWLALRGAMEELWKGAEGAVATAQTIIDAAGVTLPTGDLAEGAYDALGGFYGVPRWVVMDPENIRESGEGSDGRGRESEEEDGGVGALGKLEGEEGKGKAVAVEREMVRIKARLSDPRVGDVWVNVGRDEIVRAVARSVLEGSRLAPPKRVRIAYMGKMLRENESLLEQGWREGDVVNALVFG